MNYKTNYIVNIILLLLIITNLNNIIESVPENFMNFWQYTFPPLFISIITSKILISLNISHYLSLIIKNYSLRLLILSALIGFPGNSLFILNDYENNIIKRKDISYLICFTSLCSPIYLINISRRIFSNNYISMIIIYYLINLIICFIFVKKIKIINKIDHMINKISLVSIINESFKNIISICGIMMFFSSFSSLIDNPLLSGVIEFSNGLNILSLAHISLNKKRIIYLMILLFNSFSIHIQIANVFRNININYKPYILSRLIILLMGIIILIII